MLIPKIILFTPLVLTIVFCIFARSRRQVILSVRWSAAILALTVVEWLTLESISEMPIAYIVLKFLQVMMLVAQLIHVTEDRPGLNNPPKPNQ